MNIMCRMIWTASAAAIVIPLFLTTAGQGAKLRMHGFECSRGTPGEKIQCCTGRADYAVAQAHGMNTKDSNHVAVRDFTQSRPAWLQEKFAVVAACMKEAGCPKEKGGTFCGGVY